MTDQWSPNGRAEPDLEVLSESALAMAQATIQNAMDRSDTSKAELARHMDRSRSFITRMMAGSHNLTIKTMARALAACGYEIEFGFTPIKWNWTTAEQPVICNTVPALQEGTLVASGVDLRTVGCPSWAQGF